MSRIQCGLKRYVPLRVVLVFSAAAMAVLAVIGWMALEVKS